MTNLKPINATDILPLSKFDKEITLMLVIIFLIDFQSPCKVSVPLASNIQTKI